MINIEFYVGVAITGIFTGMGVCLGTFLSNRWLIRHIEKLERRILKNDRLYKKTNKQLKKR